jgi:hypothetical protein
MYGSETMTAARHMTALRPRAATPAERRATLLGWAGVASLLLVTAALLASLPTLAAAPTSGAAPAPLPAPAPLIDVD